MNLIKHKSLQFRSITNAAERGTSINANTGNFVVYPNPNKGSFKIEIKDTDDTEGLTVITITNLLGQTIFAKTVNTNNSIIDIKDEKLPTILIFAGSTNEKIYSTIRSTILLVIH